MKVLYISVADSYNNSSGIQKKINHQIKALHKLKVDIDAFVVTKTNHNLPLNNTDIDTNYVRYMPINMKTYPKLLNRNNPIAFKYYIEKKCYQKMNEIVQYYENLDLIYLRNLRGSPYLLQFAKKYSDKIIIEHQSKYLDEFKKSGKLLRYLLELLYKPFIYKYIRGCVCVTKEIEDYHSKWFNRMHIFTKVITNCFEVASVKIRKTPHYDNLNIRILFVGDIKYWHGVDRVINGLHHYSGDKTIKLYIIGDGEYKQTLINIVDDLRMADYVFFIDPKNSVDLDFYFDTCHVAIGSLAAHRKNMYQTSALKIREYLSRGMPFLVSDIDEDLENKEIEPFYLKVSPDDNPIKINEVIKFVEEVNIIEDHPNRIRSYALHKIDSNIKMRELKNFFSYIINN